MAAFSTIALMSAGLLANKLLNRKPKDAAATAPPLAPGPTTPLAPAAPPILNPAEANAAGLAAGAKQRKRAAAGSLLTNEIGPVSSLAPAKARTQPRTLLGA